MLAISTLKERFTDMMREQGLRCFRVQLKLNAKTGHFESVRRLNGSSTPQCILALWSDVPDDRNVNKFHTVRRADTISTEHGDVLEVELVR